MLSFNDDLMRLFARFLVPICFLCLFTACHRPTAYFQPTTHAPATRLPIDQSATIAEVLPDSISHPSEPVSVPVAAGGPVVASLRNQPTTGRPADARVHQHMSRIQSLLTTPAGSVDQQPRPRPKQKLKLGNRIREGLGMPLRKELNWWQRISWKLKASIIVIAVALLFAILNVTILAIIFGVLGAFLLITGLKRSMKVRRPWF